MNIQNEQINQKGWQPKSQLAGVGVFLALSTGP